MNFQDSLLQRSSCYGCFVIASVFLPEVQTDFIYKQTNNEVHLHHFADNDCISCLSEVQFFICRFIFGI